MSTESTQESKPERISSSFIIITAWLLELMELQKGSNKYDTAKLCESVVRGNQMLGSQRNEDMDLCGLASKVILDRSLEYVDNGRVNKEELLQKSITI
jgi:hypothetical protein